MTRCSRFEVGPSPLASFWQWQTKPQTSNGGGTVDRVLANVVGCLDAPPREPPNALPDVLAVRMGSDQARRPCAPRTPERIGRFVHQPDANGRGAITPARHASIPFVSFVLKSASNLMFFLCTPPAKWLFDDVGKRRPARSSRQVFGILGFIAMS